MVADLEAADQEVVDGVEVATAGVVTMMEAMIMVVEEEQRKEPRWQVS